MLIPYKGSIVRRGKTIQVFIQTGRFLDLEQYVCLLSKWNASGSGGATEYVYTPCVGEKQPNGETFNYITDHRSEQYSAHFLKNPPHWVEFPINSKQNKN